MNVAVNVSRTLVSMAVFFCMLMLSSGCAALSESSRSASLESAKDTKLAIIPLRDARKGERLSFDELGFRFIPKTAYTPLHLKLEECEGIEYFALRTDVREKQPLMRTHFRGL